LSLFRKGKLLSNISKDLTERSPGNEIPEEEKVENIFVLSTLIPNKILFPDTKP